MMDASSRYQQVQGSCADELVLKHAGLVKRIAYHLAARLPDSVEVNDLVQSGMIGLLEAGRQYSDQHGASFETYAGIRIRGAMLDEIRKTDWTPRSVHRAYREINEKIRQIENETGRDARDSEVAKAAGLTMEEYHRVMQDAVSCRLFSLDELQSDHDDNLPGSLDQDQDSPLRRVESVDFRQGLADTIDGLPEKERLVMSLYYEQELNLREIGEVLGVSESRVCQIHGKALTRTRARMDEWLD
ncbi:RNA polymerase sigma factor for flagellar operon FliA [Natronospira proteinivora]|uniref:RNA polymerase sigma factor FliA n=2 Tax=Natronospira proteinivora TaxID=1807133 RepID=A0ABT1G7W4_9GAMM|nr:RNA polymerase sigma factor FliA [Natronospira proteinivora]MCP1726453.1 RNA polymerase sigma factor for flagellar operon FliA [Natronospira proteinivora]